MLRRRLTSLTVREVDGETLVLDLVANRIHQLNATAALIWQQCDSAESPDDIAESLVRTFDIDRATALADVHRTVDTLREADLLC